MLKFEELPEVNSERWMAFEGLPEEVWKDVPGYENILFVSNYSRVYNKISNKILKQHTGKEGYKQVVIIQNGKQSFLYVHRLVLAAFVPNPENKKCTDHIDTNRSNNTLENLRWATHKENANNILTKKHRKDSHVNTIFSDKKVAKLDKEGNVICTYNSVTEASLDTGLKKCSISNAAHRRIMPNKYGKFFECKTAGGYKWQYI